MLCVLFVFFARGVTRVRARTGAMTQCLDLDLGVSVHAVSMLALCVLLLVLYVLFMCVCIFDFWCYYV